MTLPETWRHGPIRRYDADRRLLEAGYRWDQLRLIEKLGLGGAGVGLLCAAPFMYADHSPQGGVACLLAGLALLAILAWLHRWPRTVLFTRDGGVLTPHGLPGSPFRRRLSFPHTQINSIEATSNCRDHGVVMFTTEGHTILLAERMFKADAHLAGVQLTKALQEMRQSLATVAGQRSEPKEPVLIS